jgi:hypothetical protein
MAAFLIGAAALCGATPYWVAWEGNDLPENQGWTRDWGNWDGEYHGDGAIRTLSNGIMTLDSRFDDGVYDFSRLDRPGQVDPGPNELFVMDWRLWVEQVTGPWNGTVALFSNDAWGLSLNFSDDHITSRFEQLLTIPIVPGVFHSYRVTSPDMRGYDLYIDGALVYHGAFVKVFTPAYVAWGDGTQGGAGLQYWDHFRFGVIPEPGAFLLLLCVFVCHGGRRVTIK